MSGRSVMLGKGNQPRLKFNSVTQEWVIYSNTGLSGTEINAVVKYGKEQFETIARKEIGKRKEDILAKVKLLNPLTVKVHLVNNEYSESYVLDKYKGR